MKTDPGAGASPDPLEYWEDLAAKVDAVALAEVALAAARSARDEMIRHGVTERSMTMYEIAKRVGMDPAEILNIVHSGPGEEPSARDGL